MTDAWDSLIARHGLTFGEAVRIRDEVGTGRAFAEPRMRAAAADWARHLLEREGLAHLWGSRWRRVVLAVSLVILLAEVVRSAEIAEVQRAIVHGEALEDPRLSAAAVEAAGTQLGVLLIIVSVVTGDWSWKYVLLAVNFLAVVVPQALLRRNLRRAIAVNSRSSAP